MPTTTLPVDLLAEGLAVAAATVAPVLPSEAGLVPGPPPTGAGAPAACAGRRVVGVALDGAFTGYLALALPDTVADILAEGPRGRLDLSEALAPTLAAVAD